MDADTDIPSFSSYGELCICSMLGLLSGFMRGLLLICIYVHQQYVLYIWIFLIREHTSWLTQTLYIDRASNAHPHVFLCFALKYEKNVENSWLYNVLRWGMILKCRLLIVYLIAVDAMIQSFWASPTCYCIVWLCWTAALLTREIVFSNYLTCFACVSM